jgi:hypothetical protein
MREQVIPDRWRALNKTKRDVLVALALHGPGNGNELHLRLNGGNLDRAPATRKALQALADCGLITRTKTDAGKVNALTVDGVALVRRGILEPAAAIDDRAAPEQ